MRKIEFMDIKYVILIEPERLFLRYLKTNSIFLFLAIKQLINKFYLEKNKNN